METSPVILVDVDGVLVDHQQQHLDRVNHLYGTDYTRESVTCFDYSNFPPEHRDYLRALWYRVDYSGDFLSQETLDTIEGLRSVGTVIACSSPLPGHADSKLLFLMQYFKPEHIILTRAKNLVKGDILIDDAPHNAERFPGHFILIDQPWNRMVSGYPRAPRFEDVGPLVMEYLLEGTDAYL